MIAVDHSLLCLCPSPSPSLISLSFFLFLFLSFPYSLFRFLSLYVSVLFLLFTSPLSLPFYPNPPLSTLFSPTLPLTPILFLHFFVHALSQYTPDYPYLQPSKPVYLSSIIFPIDSSILPSLPLLPGHPRLPHLLTAVFNIHPNTITCHPTGL